MIFITLPLLLIWGASLYILEKVYPPDEILTTNKLKILIAKKIFQDFENKLINVLKDSHNMLSLYYEEGMDEDLKKRMIKSYKDYNLDLFLLTDIEGKVVLRINNLSVNGDDLKNIDFVVREALIGKSCISLVNIGVPRLVKERLKTTLLLEAGIPLESRTGRILGAIISGYSFPNPLYTQKVFNSIKEIPIISTQIMKEGIWEDDKRKQINIYENIVDTRDKKVGSICLQVKKQRLAAHKNIYLLTSLLSFIYVFGILLMLSHKKTKILPTTQQIKDLQATQVLDKENMYIPPDLYLPILLKLEDVVILVFLGYIIDKTRILEFFKTEVLSYIIQTRPKKVIIDVERLKKELDAVFELLDFITKTIHFCGSKVIISGLSQEFITYLTEKGKDFEDFVEIKRKLTYAV